MKKPLKIAYLFGAGATHAEIFNTEKNTRGIGLLMSDVSKRVFKKAQKDKSFLKDIEMVSAPEGSPNIELFISLVENNSHDIPSAGKKTEKLKHWVEEDIKKVLTKKRCDGFYLHKALFELHNLTKDRETICGLISLNYDSVLDEAYKEIIGVEPNYSFHSKFSKEIPLLKLHGSFDWKEIPLRGRKRDIPIIPLGINKNYLRIPYNFIWGHALEVLSECDVLRVIGCALSPNDGQLIDLLFKAHVEKGMSFKIEIINSEKAGDDAKYNYGFLPEIIKPREIEGTLIADLLRDDINDSFRVWLKQKGDKMLPPKKIKKTVYLKRLII